MPRFDPESLILWYSVSILGPPVSGLTAPIGLEKPNQDQPDIYPRGMVSKCSGPFPLHSHTPHKHSDGYTVLLNRPAVATPKPSPSCMRVLQEATDQGECQCSPQVAAGHIC